MIWYAFAALLLFFAEGDNVDDERYVFTHGEVVSALSLIMPQDEALGMARQILDEAPAGQLGSVHLSDDLLDLLSLVSDDAAQRVAGILHIPPAEAAVRRAAVRARLRLT